MTRLTALVGVLLAALLLTAATASATTRKRHHHHHHHGKTQAGHGHRALHRYGHERRRPAPRPAPARAPAPAPATGRAASASGCANASTPPDGANAEALRTSVLCLVNQQRAGNGLAPLTDNAALDRAAQGHSDDMVARAYFSHSTPDGADFSSRILAAGYPSSYRALAENIAWGSGTLSTPAQIVSNWMSSPGHRANILNGALHESGIGIAAGAPQGGTGQAGTYTQDFGTA
jgi:uncharacterized protein YkwD